METAESGYPIDEAWYRTADPDLIESLSLGEKRPYACHLEHFTISVRTINYHGGQERGSCAVWDKGDFVVAVNGRDTVTVPAPQCNTEIRHDLSVQGKQAHTAAPTIWSVDCAYRKDTVAYDPSFSCTRLRDRP